jgi:hypothetical protein
MVIIFKKRKESRYQGLTSVILAILGAEIRRKAFPGQQSQKCL